MAVRASFQVLADMVVQYRSYPTEAELEAGLTDPEQADVAFLIQALSALDDLDVEMAIRVFERVRQSSPYLPRDRVADALVKVLIENI